jgi:hypothetical protein
MDEIAPLWVACEQIVASEECSNWTCKVRAPLTRTNFAAATKLEELARRHFNELRPPRRRS